MIIISKIERFPQRIKVSPVCDGRSFEKEVFFPFLCMLVLWREGGVGEGGLIYRGGGNWKGKIAERNCREAMEMEHRTAPVWEAGSNSVAFDGPCWREEMEGRREMRLASKTRVATWLAGKTVSQRRARLQIEIPQHLEGHDGNSSNSKAVHSSFKFSKRENYDVIVVILT